MTEHLGLMPLTNSASRGTLKLIPRQSLSRDYRDTIQLASNSQLKGNRGQTKPAIASWLPFPCPECSQQLALAPTITGEFDSDNFIIRCTNPYWPIEYLLEEILLLYPEIVVHLPDGHDPATIFRRGREDSLLFGKGLGTNQSGKARSEQFRYAIDVANGLKWNVKKPNGPGERDRLYDMKTTVGLFEKKPMKSVLEMTSRKIEKIERKRHMKIPEPMVDEISKLIRKGITNAENRRPTTSCERRLIVESIMQRMELWPP